MWWMALGLAWAGGSGGYGELQWGASRTDAHAFIARGKGLQLGFGGYTGSYRGSWRYGKYWRGGVVLKTQVIESGGRKVDVNWSPGVRIGRGFDLMNLGAWWTLTTGPTIVYRTRSFVGVFDPDANLEPLFGAFVSGAVGVAYNFSHEVAINLRYEPGLQFDGDGMSYLGGVGLGLQFRVPLLRHNFDDDDDEAAAGR